MSVLGIDHVQYCFPPGKVERARVFWRDVMGLIEIPRPPALVEILEGAWFVCGAQEIHIGSEEGFQPAKKAHTALQVDDLAAVTQRLSAAGYEILPWVLPASKDIPSVKARAMSWDAFGNRLELMQRVIASASSPALPAATPSVSPQRLSLASNVLLLGDPRLRVRSPEVINFTDEGFRRNCSVLAATLTAFRDKHGFGRAISAPQIGVQQRFIAVNLGKGVFFVVNPVYTYKSDETFTMWDDCMSFPDLLVKVRRHQSISLSYHDEDGKQRTWEKINIATAELLQHEIDHLEGVLAVDRALHSADGQGTALVIKSVYDANKEAFRKEVDYVIGD